MTDQPTGSTSTGADQPVAQFSKEKVFDIAYAAYCEKHESTYTPIDKLLPELLYDFLLDAEIVHVGDTNVHRWRTDQEIVVAIDAENVRYYFQFMQCIYSGDNSAIDAGFMYPTLDDVIPFRARQVTTTIYEPVQTEAT